MLRDHREITIASGLSAQNDRRALFGLGAYAGPLTVTIAWCGDAGRVQGHLALDRYHVIDQPDRP